jgi:hypothetical protein
LGRKSRPIRQQINPAVGQPLIEPMAPIAADALLPPPDDVGQPIDGRAVARCRVLGAPELG